MNTKNDGKPYVVQISFPSCLEYVIPIRKFISEVLVGNNYSQKFAYRSEVIVDEVCSNAVIYGSKTQDACIDFTCYIYEDHIEFQVKDQGGTKKDVERLKVAVNTAKEFQQDQIDLLGSTHDGCLGMEIVRMLSEEVQLEFGENNVTTIRVVRKRKPA